MSIESVSLAIIATCMLIITVSIIVLTIISYSLLQKIGKLIDKTEAEVISSVKNLKKNLEPFTETFRGFAAIAKFITGRKRGK